eukprot:2673604-Pyramimonas_sp.AAC.1
MGGPSLPTTPGPASSASGGGLRGGGFRAVPEADQGPAHRPHEGPWPARDDQQPSPGGHRHADCGEEGVL